jgi:predicted hydrocarbon binding protein
MEINLEYDDEKGIYLLNKIRVLVLPKGSLESLQNSVNMILGLATKSIFQEVSSTVFYSFLQDLIKRKSLKIRGGERAEIEIFDLFKGLGLGRINKISSDLNAYKISIEGNANSFLNMISNSPYCFNSLGILAGIYRIITNRDVEVTEEKCRSTGDSDIDYFNIDVKDEKQEYPYIPSQIFDQKNENLKKIEIIKDETDIFVNSIPSEIIPVVYFPYLFSKLRRIIGQGVYGIENQAGKELAKLYQQYNLEAIKERYGLNDLSIMSILSGFGKINTLKTDLGYFLELDVYNSFNALHVDDAIEKRCFLLGSVLSSLSYKITGATLKLSEKECSAVNNEVCKFSFG